MRKLIVAALLGWMSFTGPAFAESQPAGPQLLCVPYPVAKDFAAKGWRVLTSDIHGAVVAQARDKKAEIEIVEAASCALFDPETGKLLTKPKPVYFFFWRPGVEL